ncbi:hypothetical protein [Streptomyces sp. NPDC001781]
MHLVTFRIVAPRCPVAPDEARILRVALEQAVRGRAGAEHVRVHTSRSGAVGVLFWLAAEPAEARAHGLAFCAEVLAGLPQFGGWRVIGL